MKIKTLIVGLGNPGEKYEKTRHNTGFMVLDALCGEFKLEKRFNTEACELEGGVACMKPQTFMNSSGEAVKSFVDYYKVAPENVWVVYDDVDIPFGEIRIREGGSSAGHKGVESIIKHLGTRGFLRFRVGIKNEMLDKTETEDFVLQRFDKNEEQDLSYIIKLSTDEINRTLETGDRKPKTLKKG